MGCRLWNLHLTLAYLKDQDEGHISAANTPETCNPCISPFVFAYAAFSSSWYATQVEKRWMVVAVETYVKSSTTLTLIFKVKRYKNNVVLSFLHNGWA